MRIIATPSHWFVATALALMMAVAAGGWRVESDRSVYVLVSSIEGMKRHLSAVSETGKVATSELDFTQRLAESSTIDPILREVQRSSAAAGVAFLSVSIASRSATLRTVGRTEQVMVLRGTYPQLKAVLSQTLDRFPDLVVQRLTLHRTTTPLDLEARVDFMLPSRPLAASSAGG